MDISKDLKNSLLIIQKYKILVLPGLISFIFLMVLCALFWFGSGLGSAVTEFTGHYHDFEQQKKDYVYDLKNIQDSSYGAELMKYLLRDSSNSAYEKEFKNYIDSIGYEPRFEELFTLSNIIFFIICLITGLVAYTYSMCATYVMVSQIIMSNKFQNIHSNSIKLFFKMVGLSILNLLLYFLPLLLFIPSIVLMTLGGFFALIGVILFLVLIFAYFAYIIFISLKLIFSIPIMVVEKQDPFNSMKSSYKMTNGYLKTVVVVGLVSYGLSILLNSIVQSPLSQILSNLLYSQNYFVLFFSFLIYLALSLITIVYYVFISSFRIYTYLDFKKKPDLIKKVSKDMR